MDTCKFLVDDPVDVIFLEIQMPDLTRIEFARTLDNPSKFIFLTDVNKYAVEGFKLDAIGYLLKPFNYQEFLKAGPKKLQS